MSKAHPGIIVKRDSSETRDWLATEPGFLEGLCRIGHRSVLLEPFQRTFMRLTAPDGTARARFRVVNKSRQVGFSFSFAAESFARSHIIDSYGAVHTSYNLADAKLKIDEAKRLHEGMPLAYQKKLITDTRTELVFQGNGRRAGRSKIKSMPARAPRGVNGDVYLDEFAHVANDREIYEGAQALLLRSKGQLTIASTPLGRRGMFYEIATGCLAEQPYSEFARMAVPWWYCTTMCVDVRRAVHIAQGMSTAERVALFSTKPLRDIFENMSLEAFCQEFECDFSEIAGSFYPNTLIQSCMPTEHSVVEDPDDMPAVAPDSRRVCGVDIGRTSDKTVCWVADQGGAPAKPHFDTVLCKKMTNVPFREQEDFLRRVLHSPGVVSMRIDDTGIGRNLAENLSTDFPGVAQGVTFTAQIKERLATNMKILMQQSRIVMPADRILKSDINSVVRRVSQSGNVLFEAKRTKDGHADRFWSLALACDIEAPRPTGGKVRAWSI